MRSSASLIEQRRLLVSDRVRFKNRLRSALKQYFPQTLYWFEQIDTMLFCDFLSQWPTLLAVERAHSKTLEAFFHSHNCRRALLIEQLIKSIRSAAALTNDTGIITPYRLHSLALVAQLRTTLAAIDMFDKEIAALVPTLPASHCLSRFQVRGRIRRRACSLRSASNANAFTARMSYSSMPASQPSPSGAARKAGCIGAGNVRDSCARRLSNGPTRLSTNCFGRRLLSPAARQGSFAPGCGEGTGIQMDTRPLPMLANWSSL
ncbi:hypothetical protein CBA19CS11_30735 [Caballeronia novacaledonica]|nr:hypothetical protein CBA19CS11_30735 [Caballeronia novacaledonica]